MKKILLSMFVLVLALSGCTKSDLDDIRARLSSLEAWQASVNTDIKALQTSITALQEKDYVTSVTQLTDGSGYQITFQKSGTVTVSNGKNGAAGADGVSPVIGVTAVNGVYYWTVDTGGGATFLLDSAGEKIPTTGKNGTDGNDGTDGKDAVAPQVRINSGTNIWEISTDGGTTWVSTGVNATGAKGDKGDKGEQGDAVFAENGVDNSNADYVTLTLADGTTKIALPRYMAFKIGTDTGNEVLTIDASTTIPLSLPSGFKESGYTAIMAQITSDKGTSTDIKTRAATAPWTVTVNKPTFTNGVYNGDASVTVTPPSGIVEGENAILEVTLVGNDGSKLTATRSLCYKQPLFSDANFRKEVIALMKKNKTPLKDEAGTVELAEDASSIPLTDANKAVLAAFTGTLDVLIKSITSLSGIEYLTGLTKLYCPSNNLTSLDVSKNTQLTRLRCSFNRLTFLDVSKNTQLTRLDCSYNSLTRLDVSKNTQLTLLSCYSNHLTRLDVSQNTQLKELYCYSNRLTSLDVSKNTQLTVLRCYSNRLESLDISPLSKIEYWQVGNQNDAAGNSGATIKLTLKKAQEGAKDGTDNNKDIEYITVP